MRRLQGVAVDPSLRGHGPEKGQRPTRNPDVDARRALARAMSEEAFLRAITEALTFLGYRWTHSRRSDKALTMGHQGVPDIIAARNGRVWFIELKSERGRLDPEQFAWFHALGWPTNATCELRIWFPSDLDKALAELAA